MVTFLSTSERTMTPQTETIYNQLVMTLTMISYSVKPSMVRYQSNLLYCAIHGSSKKLPRVYNKTRTKLPLTVNHSYQLRRSHSLTPAWPKYIKRISRTQIR
jgi:hypothetical protein